MPCMITNRNALLVFEDSIVDHVGAVEESSSALQEIQPSLKRQFRSAEKLAMMARVTRPRASDDRISKA